MTLSLFANPTSSAAGRRQPRPRVLFYSSNPQAALDGHDVISSSQVAAGLAQLMGCEFGGLVQNPPPSAPPDQPIFFVPSQTLGSAQAHALGIRNDQHLFGGVVPHPFVATKLISHPLVPGSTVAPVGWSQAYAERIHHAVLPGYSVFCADDARLAAPRLFERGAVRVKDPRGIGGVGQWVVHDMSELQQRLDEFGDDGLHHGLVLELNLATLETVSVGQMQVGGRWFSYHGTQDLTRNHHGHEVYGGSQLIVSRGGLTDLLHSPLPPLVQTAVQQALTYHDAALDCFDGFFASRCNYDIAQGVDERGHVHSGVLEQSWRIGGASGAEVAAMRLLQAEPSVTRVRASTTERYGPVVVPADAWVLFDGVDRKAGRLTKYVQVQAHGDD